MTATPSVPPVSRVASLTAEPTPALAGGRTLRIDSVAGVEINPIPDPIISIWITMIVYGIVAETCAIHRNDPARSARPAQTITRVPRRPARLAPRTEKAPRLSATGRIRTPVDRAL